jgi:quercetin dioxygenase-like cupin family protein
MKATFGAMDWETPAVGVLQKVFKQREKSLRLLQFTREMAHPEWCTVGHTGYVLDGTMEVMFADQTITYTKGDGIIIPPGNNSKHIPRAVTDSVTLILIDEV